MIYSTITYDHYDFSPLVGWHPSGTTLASASFDATVCIWDRKDTGMSLQTTLTLIGELTKEREVQWCDY